MPHFAKPGDLSAPHEPTVLINARVIDPATGTDQPGGVLIENGLITKQQLIFHRGFFSLQPTTGN